ncbi:MAG: hypothetical protein ACXW32_16750 [Limisphaerales bacterium]
MAQKNGVFLRLTILMPGGDYDNLMKNRRASSKVTIHRPSVFQDAASTFGVLGVQRDFEHDRREIPAM